MALSTSIKYQAFELILHGYGWRTIQHELGVSKGAIDAWRNFIESGIFLGLINIGVPSTLINFKRLLSSGLTIPFLLPLFLVNLVYVTQHSTSFFRRNFISYLIS